MKIVICNLYITRLILKLEIFFISINKIHFLLDNNLYDFGLFLYC
jgi:hypothetical protein